MAQMFHICYVSSAIRPFTKPQLLALHRRSKEKNQRLGITGLLLYQDGNFMQVLEGEEQNVRHLYETIYGDPRHKDIYILFAERVAEREFPNWSMAFRDLNEEKGLENEGFSNFLQTVRADDEQTTKRSKALAMLATFRDNLR